MTNQKINEAIAKEKHAAFINIKGVRWIEGKIQIHENGTWKTVDYTSNPALILELEDELLSDSWELGKGPTNYYWVSTEYSKCGKGTIIRDTKHGKATALAWMRMKGVEV